MRIIGGKFKGRRFYPPADKWPTRPTTDFAKEGLFNMLNNRLDFEDIKALDLFGGTGNHAYELISRGCSNVTYVDKFPPCLAFVKKIAMDLGITDLIRIVKADVFRFMENTAEQYDYIFADPPYALPKLEDLPNLVFRHGLLLPGGLLVMEHDPRHSFKTHPFFQEERHYGKTIFSFFALPKTD
jgi:16S rRNA (guanine966-N2)-methyltransferase